VDKTRLDKIISNPQIADGEDLKFLEDLVAKYPYAQFLRILISKVSQNLDDMDQVNRLNSAAIYSADRSVLKSFITEKDFKITLPKSSYQVHSIADMSVDSETEISQETPEPAVEHKEPEPDIIQERENIGKQKDPSKKIFNEVLRNLDVLKTLRNKYTFLEKSEEETGEVKSQETDKQQAPLEVEQELPKHSTPDDLTADQETVQDEIDPSIQKAKEKYVDPQQAPVDDSPEQKTPDPEYQKELIDSFIGQSHSIGRKDLKTIEPEDKSQEDLSLGSIVYESDIVSENLADIYVKQGKKEKATEIYKKLIWKFPQKKAYFAARIQEIKG
jgi:hypothetical protein